LESESAFEDRMSALSREIGGRGRADAVVDCGEPEPGPDGSTALRLELGKLKLSALRKRAAGTEAVEADIEAAEDAEDPTAAMVALILAHEKPSEDPAAKLRAELEALKPSALRKRAKAAGASEDDIEDAGDAEEPKSAMIALILASAPEAAESER